jgi:hypothetical protein
VRRFNGPYFLEIEGMELVELFSRVFSSHFQQHFFATRVSVDKDEIVGGPAFLDLFVVGGGGGERSTYPNVFSGRVAYLVSSKRLVASVTILLF